MNKKMWMAPDQAVYAEGFEDLFKVNPEYQIPAPSPGIRERLTKLLVKDKNSIMNHNHEDFNFNIGTLFNRVKQNPSQNKEVQMPSQAMPQAMSKNAPQLQLVQAPTAQVNIVVVEPRTFEDSLEIVNHLKERKSIIVNLQHLDRDVSQRVIDFVSGATLALDGTQERVGHGVFIFASMNCQVQTEAEGLRNYKDLFSKSFG
jgi:FtsZ-interacting cell division protein YlmF